MARGKKAEASGAKPSPAKPVKGFFDKSPRKQPALAEPAPAITAVSSEHVSQIESALRIYRREKSKLAKQQAVLQPSASSTRSSKRQKLSREAETEARLRTSSQALDKASGDAAGGCCTDSLPCSASAARPRSRAARAYDLVPKSPTAVC